MNAIRAARVAGRGEMASSPGCKVNLDGGAATAMLCKPDGAI